MMVERIYSFLGLAAKAGRLITGEEACERALKLGKVYLVIVSADASDNTKKKFNDKCKYRSIAIRYFGQKELLGKRTGKAIRSVVAITDKGFSGRLQEMIDSSGLEHGGA
jgi:ribosomal protein L7Ae-like RNA K-turn-binding protein